MGSRDKDRDWTLMPCFTCKSFNPKINVDPTTGYPVAGGCHGCGIIPYGCVVECALHDKIGSPPKDYRYFENTRNEFAKKYPDLADNRIFYISEYELENRRNT